MKKLREPQALLKKFLDHGRLLGEHLGPVLYQLPPHWHLDLQRLEAFLEVLPCDLLHVFEFRDQSWLVENVFTLLEERGVSYCTHDFPDLVVPRLATGPIVYVRLHGTEQRYQGRYPESILRQWWGWMEEHIRRGKDVYVYFNNDAAAHAVFDALRLKRLAGMSTPHRRQSTSKSNSRLV